MKLWKKLMPVATVAATAACVVPMVTSCSSAVLSTSDFNFKPEQLAKKEYEKIEDAAKDYITPKNFANDMFYVAIQNMLTKQRDSWAKTHSQWEFNFTLTLNDLTVGTEVKKTTITDTQYFKVTGDFIGYLVSGSFTITYNCSGYDVYGPSKTVKTVYKSESSTIEVSFKDFFFGIQNTNGGTGQNWFTAFFGGKTLSENASIKLTQKSNTNTITKYSDGKTIENPANIIAESLGNVKDLGTIMFGIMDEPVNEWPAYVFDNAAIKK